MFLTEMVALSWNLLSSCMSKVETWKWRFFKEFQELINNTANTGANITSSAPYITTIGDFKPIKALYLATDISIDSMASSGSVNLLKRMVVTSDNDLVSDDSQRHRINVVGNQQKDKLNFKVTDIHGNTIDMLEKSWSFSLVLER